MNVRNLVIKEIWFRKSSFLLSGISVAAAVAVIMGTAALFHAHKRSTEQTLVQKADDMKLDMAKMRDDYRIFMKDMGYNSVILHKDQSVSEFLTTNRTSFYMPEDYVHRLAQSKRASYNHLLPTLQQKIIWPEHNVEIFLSGTSGQVPVQAKPKFWNEDGYLDPIRADIPPGQIEIGYGLGTEFDIKKGQSISFMGQGFVVHRVLPSQGNIEDITIWCSLEDVQRWLDKPGKINAIYALECMGDAPRLGGIVNHVPKVLPDTHVLQFASLIDTRIQARRRASHASSAAMETDTQHSEQIYKEYSIFFLILLPVTIAASGIWLFWLFSDNVRQRKSEIGIMRAMGVKQKTINTVFVFKAVLAGLCGSVPGYFLGMMFGIFWGGESLFFGSFFGSNNLLFLLVAVIIAPMWCVLAGLLPTIWAAKQDPVDVLKDV